MDDLKMNKQLGTKWFTFYTKVRPWLACLSALGVLSDFLQYTEIYTSFWWLTLYLLASIAQPVLAIIVFVKSQGDYEDFVHFVKGVLIFETINMAYGQAVQQYVQNDFDVSYALVVGVIILVLAYFIWYRLNMKYFKKRINVITNDCLSYDPNRLYECKSCGYTNKDYFVCCPECGNNTKQYAYINVEKNEEKPLEKTKVSFCRKCGNKLLEDSQFCNKCGTKVINEEKEHEMQ